MVIAVNTRLLLKDRLEGIGWFTFETFRRIARDHSEHQFIFIFDRPFPREFVFTDNITPVVVWPPTRHPVLWYIWFEYCIPAVLKKYHADIFISPDGYLSMRASVPQLAVIHDINFVHRPKDLPRLTSAYYNYFFPRFAGISSRIVTVSGFSAGDIAQNFNVDRDKIDIVYNGFNPDYAPAPENEIAEIRRRYSEGYPYFLFIGALHPRKNLVGLLRAFDLFKGSGGHREKLIIVGAQMFKTGAVSSTLKGMVHSSDVIFTGRVPSSELQKILAGALALTFVPFFEGFGIPVAEAMAAGVPVICSGTTSLPEVGGDAALYVDPENTAEIAGAMQRISTDLILRKSLIEKGNRQIRKFSWDKSAQLLWRSIEKVMAMRRPTENHTGNLRLL
jgi:glycosyltransferase involved in cell wall biosynthesis